MYCDFKNKNVKLIDENYPQYLIESIQWRHESIQYDTDESIQTESRSVHGDVVESIQEEPKSILHNVIELIHHRDELIQII